MTCGVGSASHLPVQRGLNLLNCGDKGRLFLHGLGKYHPGRSVIHERMFSLGSSHICCFLGIGIHSATPWPSLVTPQPWLSSHSPLYSHPLPSCAPLEGPLAVPWGGQGAAGTFLLLLLLQPSPRSKYGHRVSTSVPTVPASRAGAGQFPCLCHCCPRGCGCCASGTPWVAQGGIQSLDSWPRSGPC